MTATKFNKIFFEKEQDISSDIEQQPPFGDSNKAIHSLKIGGGLQKQREHNII